MSDQIHLAWGCSNFKSLNPSITVNSQTVPHWTPLFIPKQVNVIKDFVTAGRPNERRHPQARHWRGSLCPCGVNVGCVQRYSTKEVPEIWMIDECIPKVSEAFRRPGRTVLTGKPWMKTFRTNSKMKVIGSVAMNLGAPKAKTLSIDHL